MTGMNGTGMTGMNGTGSMSGTGMSAMAGMNAMPGMNGAVTVASQQWWEDPWRLLGWSLLILVTIAGLFAVVAGYRWLANRTGSTKAAPEPTPPAPGS